VTERLISVPNGCLSCYLILYLQNCLVSGKEEISAEIWEGIIETEDYWRK